LAINRPIISDRAAAITPITIKNLMVMRSMIIIVDTSTAEAIVIGLVFFYLPEMIAEKRSKP